MAVSDDEAMEGRLSEFLNARIGRHLSRREQKESFALYAHGILADGERKSVEPIAARATGSGDGTIRLALARAIARWLPRCPLCHRANGDPEHGLGHHVAARIRRDPSQ